MRTGLPGNGDLRAGRFAGKVGELHGDQRGLVREQGVRAYKLIFLETAREKSFAVFVFAETAD